MAIHLVPITVHALIHHDVEDGMYTIYTLEKGRPIISDVSEEISKKKFEDALKLSTAVRNLHFFEGYNESPTVKMRNWYSAGSKITDVEYHEMSL